ncbi:MAG: hypothetical protein AVDCRST_MAG89-1412 [uncultured Gemmatimonadetes bacterium]|uniref:Uncharacterized protein n=1 Tax=uncultured Gemmatimonadota bacterium TaxID=203437 RepID=A0A6J4KX09_9BACT|nr:MAG: hypothetical protein AVDCRST_MAG89-1412 [uncultured Gemmatimonadota bacterium]
MKPVDWTLVAAVLYVALALLVLWAVFRGLWAAARAVAGSFGTKGTLLAGNARIKLLGLAISALLFTRLISRLIRAVLNLFVALSDRLPRHLLVHWRSQADLCDPAGARCVGDTLLVLAQATGAGIASAFRASGILSIGFGYLVFMLALWAVATHVLSAAFNSGDGDKDLDVRDLLFEDRFKVTRQNFLFFLILFVGAYLSLASIAAIPDLRAEQGPLEHDNPGQHSKLTGLGKVELGGTDRPDNPFAPLEPILYPGLAAASRDAPKPRPKPTSDTATPADTNTTPRPVFSPRQTESDDAAEVDGTTAQPAEEGGAAAASRDEGAPGASPGGDAGTEALADTPEAAAGDTDPAQEPQPAAISPAIPDEHVAALQAQMNELRQIWGAQTVSHDSASRSLKRQAGFNEMLVQAALTDEDTTRAVRAHQMYRYRLDRWLLESGADIRADYDKSWLDLRRLERKLNGWSIGAAGYLTSPDPHAAHFQELRSQGQRLSTEAGLIAEHSARPPRPLPARGEELGPFRYVSGWLLKTGSMPLTLIVGMLGFGLLGAAASTFVREQTRRERRESAWIRRWQREYAKRPRSDSRKEAAADAAAKADAATPDRPSQPLVLNLPSVVIRGGSAAIVVFLGIMGGLSVLTQEAEPNPYALLFTCLVGAVFSENVWTWAERRFGLNLGGEEDDVDRSGDQNDADKGRNAKRPGDTGDGGQAGEGGESGEEGGESGEEGGESGQEDGESEEVGGGEGEEGESDTRGSGGDVKP